MNGLTCAPANCLGEKHQALPRIEVKSICRRLHARKVCLERVGLVSQTIGDIDEAKSQL